MTEALEHLPLIDVHSVVADAAPEAVFDAVERRFAGWLSGRLGGALSRLWGCEPAGAFEVVAEERPTLIVVAGKHRFSRYGIVFRINPTSTGSTLSAESHAEFPGLHGRAYKALVVDSRLHVIATRRLLGEIADSAEH
ncbi:MAG TPA: hypothetical protein VHD81_06450 [Mycobacteriales bacterium]|nr:hypothetical protein [Mycobacteriales bacterium]